jgi:hypothetical protein
METLICPQCGAQLDESHVTGDVVRCQYCATQFRVPHAAPTFDRQPAPAVVNMKAVKTGIGIIALMPIVIMLMVFVFIGGIFYFVFTSINHTVGTAVNAAQHSVNDAQTSANAMKAAANAMANAARQKANNAIANVTAPAQTPKQK